MSTKTKPELEKMASIPFLFIIGNTVFDYHIGCYLPSNNKWYSVAGVFDDEVVINWYLLPEYDLLLE